MKLYFFDARGKLRQCQKYGFDTKYAMHMCRLGLQGVEFLRSGRLTLPMPEPDRQWVRDIRIGKVTQQECLSRAGELEREMKDLLNDPNNGIPERGDAERVWTFVRRMYLEHWKCEAFIDGVGSVSVPVSEASTDTAQERSAEHVLSSPPSEGAETAEDTVKEQE